MCRSAGVHRGKLSLKNTNAFPSGVSTRFAALYRFFGDFFSDLAFVRIALGRGTQCLKFLALVIERCLCV